MEVLLQHNANPLMTDNKGKTAYDYAVDHGKMLRCRFLYVDLLFRSQVLGADDC